MFPLPYGSGSTGGGVAEVSCTDDSIDTGSATTYTFSSQALGAAASDRKIVVGAFAVNAVKAVSSMTIGGVSATLVVASTNSGGEQIELWQADVPTGTTGDVVVTWAGSQLGCGIGVFRIVSAASAAHDTGSFATTGTATDTLNIPANGVAVGVAGTNPNGIPTWTWTGLTEDYEEGGVIEPVNGSHTGASDAFATTQTGLTISAAPTSAGVRGNVMAIASWGPA